MTRWHYNWSTARNDLLAGVTVAAIAIPQAMAYALIAGVDPRFGLYSAIIVTFVASIFGSSSHLINGPTNAISLVVFSALAFFAADARLDAYQAMFLLGIMIGVIQILIAVFKLGDLTRYISESVVIGFMAGAGFLVALSQMGNFLGIKDRGTGHQHVLPRVWMTLTEGGPVNWHSFGIGLGAIILVVALTKAFAPVSILPQFDMLAGSDRDVYDRRETRLVAARRVGTFPSRRGRQRAGEFPFAAHPRIPSGVDEAIVRQRICDRASRIAGGAGHRQVHRRSNAADLDYNQQCLAEGLANLTGGFFQCLPGSGSLTRSAINFQAGAVTRVSGLFAAVAVALVVVSLAPLARFIPKPALAGLLLVTAVRLVDWKRLSYAMRASRFRRRTGADHGLCRCFRQRRILDSHRSRALDYPVSFAGGAPESLAVAGFPATRPPQTRSLRHSRF